MYPYESFISFMNGFFLLDKISYYYVMFCKKYAFCWSTIAIIYKDNLSFYEPVFAGVNIIKVIGQTLTNDWTDWIFLFSHHHFHDLHDDSAYSLIKYYYKSDLWSWNMIAKYRQVGHRWWPQFHAMYAIITLLKARWNIYMYNVYI